jgi:hypothetical protein
VQQKAVVELYYDWHAPLNVELFMQDEQSEP